MGDKIALPDRRLLIDTLRDYVEQIREEGMEGLPLGQTGIRPASDSIPMATSGVPAKAASAGLAAVSAGIEAAAPPLARPSVVSAPELFSKYPGLEKTGDLQELRTFIGECTRCKLYGGRTNLVFGVGDANADLVFVGEGPGADEDARGEPFVGRAGQLLTDIIERGMGMRRAEVYICNVVKCRPPGNRNPEPDEVAACEPFLFRQLEIVKPKVIVGLGTFAVQCLLKVKTPISKLRGNWHEVRGIRMMPTFHPAYLLRNPGDKRLVWRDIQEVMAQLGRPVPRRDGNA